MGRYDNTKEKITKVDTNTFTNRQRIVNESLARKARARTRATHIQEHMRGGNARPCTCTWHSTDGAHAVRVARARGCKM